MHERNYTIVDIETTGGNPKFHRIIEIGILRIEKGELVEKYKSFVNPGAEIPEFISSFTGISQKQVDKAPDFGDIAEEIFPLFEDAVFVAHNSSFDYSFLKQSFKTAGFAFHLDTLCTVRLSRALFPEFKKHNLSALVERYNFICKNRHRAFDDAKVLWDFFQYLETAVDPKILDTAIRRTIKKISPSRQRKMGIVEIPELEYIVSGD
jgi:DNA polymerase-3 subunit epsilon